jgi:hypothetical protein
MGHPYIHVKIINIWNVNFDHTFTKKESDDGNIQSTQGRVTNIQLFVINITQWNALLQIIEWNRPHGRKKNLDTRIIIKQALKRRSSDSSVSIVMSYGLDGLRSSPGRGKIFLFSSVEQSMGPTQHPIQWTLGAPSLGLKRQRSEADNSVLRWRMMELYLHSPIFFHGTVFN